MKFLKSCGVLKNTLENPPPSGIIVEHAKDLAFRRLSNNSPSHLGKFSNISIILFNSGFGGN